MQPPHSCAGAFGITGAVIHSLCAVRAGEAGGGLGDWLHNKSFPKEVHMTAPRPLDASQDAGIIKVFKTEDTRTGMAQHGLARRVQGRNCPSQPAAVCRVAGRHPWLNACVLQVADLQYGDRGV